jgi:hypothetical protein
MNKGNVYIVHCIDAEGPLYEPIQATFDRIRNIFGYEFEPRRDILQKLQRAEIPLTEKNEKDVAIMLLESRIRNHSSFDQIEEMLDIICSDNFRQHLPDSKGNGWKYNWFCLDHVGFNGLNPRRRIAGYHSIFDFYIDKVKGSQDSIHWHYHPLPFTDNYNDSGYTYLNSSNIWEILARKIIERNWFPSAFRAGFHTERPDSNWFLEQWIPFDYSNQSTKNLKNSQPDLSEGRYGDWRHAPIDWYPYHPDHDDYQSIGNCRRWITRCLNIDARIREITQNDVDDAFIRADFGNDAILAFCDHDFRDMEQDVNKMQKMIFNAKRKYMDVDYYYEDPISACRKALNLKPIDPILNCNLINFSRDKVLLDVYAQNTIFGPQPFLAVEGFGNRFIWENFDKHSNSHWSFTFDNNNIPFESVKNIGIAANSPEGVTDVINITNNGKISCFRYNS